MNLPGLPMLDVYNNKLPFKHKHTNKEHQYKTIQQFILASEREFNFVLPFACHENFASSLASLHISRQDKSKMAYVLKDSEKAHLF